MLALGLALCGSGALLGAHSWTTDPRDVGMGPLPRVAGGAARQRVRAVGRPGVSPCTLDHPLRRTVSLALDHLSALFPMPSCAGRGADARERIPFHEGLERAFELPSRPGAVGRVHAQQAVRATPDSFFAR